jgi:hypothetical protein
MRLHNHNISLSKCHFLNKQWFALNDLFACLIVEGIA